jgi:hypothetical protein
MSRPPKAPLADSGGRYHPVPAARKLDTKNCADGWWVSVRRFRVPVLLALAAAGVLAGCGGDAGQPGGGLGIATTQPAATPSTAAAATTTPEGGTRPSAATTTTTPATTGQAVQVTGARLTFRAMTIRLLPGWRATRDAADRVTVASGGACRRSAGGVDCPGFLLLGPSQIAIGHELGPYRPERVWHPGTGVEGCPADRDGLVERTPARPRTAGFAKVGTRQAVYRDWRIVCLDAGTLQPESSYRQRVWYLPSSRILVVDEWSTPGLAGVLAAATFA